MKTIKTIVLLLVLILAVLTVIKLDLSLSAFAATGTNVAQYPENLPQDLCNPLAGGKVTSPFGERTNPITQKYEHHNGVDLSAVEGTPIRLMLDGTVSEVGESEI